MNSLLNTLQAYLPAAYDFAVSQETIILKEGQPLSAPEIKDALCAGVSEPEKIRVMKVVSLPEPENSDMMFIAKHIGLFQPHSVGLTFGYGIHIRLDMRDSRHHLVHECVHVGQYERLGGIRPFLERYLRECIEPGYPFGALEQEAVVISREICKSGSSVSV